MKDIKLYPPGGGGPVTPHPSRVEQMKSIGYTEKPVKQTPTPKPQKEDDK